MQFHEQRWGAVTDHLIVRCGSVLFQSNDFGVNLRPIPDLATGVVPELTYVERFLHRDHARIGFHSRAIGSFPRSTVQLGWRDAQRSRERFEGVPVGQQLFAALETTEVTERDTGKPCDNL